VGSWKVSGADWMLLGDRMGREILVCERNWETVDCRRVHSEGAEWRVVLTGCYWRIEWEGR